MILAVVAVAILGGCGGGGNSDPGDAVESASKHLDQVEGEFLLAQAELDRQFFRQAEAKVAANPEGADRGEQRSLLEARRALNKCIEGDGLESCTEVESIREIVTELHQALYGGG
jgi:hypothetical protein